MEPPGRRAEAAHVTRAPPRVARMRDRVLLALLLAILLAPAAGAHITGARPVLQRGQFPRIVDIQPAALDLDVGLDLEGDPLRHLVGHHIEPARGLLRVEYREDASVAEPFFGEWRFDRLVEFRDLNINGKYEPALDTAVKAWRFEHYAWRRAAIQQVQVEDVSARSIVWEGNLTGAPQIRLEAVFAGKDFTDEGIIVRPQDAAIYLDFLALPPRGVGSLYALEVRVRAHESADLTLHSAEGTNAALLSDMPLRRGLLVWGGEALIDGVEQRVNGTLEDERTESGERMARLVLHIPTADREMRFVMVSGVEYASEDQRAPFPGAIATGLALLVVAMLVRRRVRAA